MPKPKTSLQQLIHALNEAHPAYRQHLLTQAVADDVVVRADGRLLAGSREDLDARIAELLVDPACYVGLSSFEGSGPAASARWNVHSTDHPPRTQTLSLSYAPDGLLTSIDATTLSADDEARSVRARAEQVLIANPIAAIGAAGGALYLALRLPLGAFYGTLGVAPDDIGFGPQVLVPQSVTLLVAFTAFLIAFFVGIRLVPPTTDALFGSMRVARLQGNRGPMFETFAATFGTVLLVSLAANLPAAVVASDAGVGSYADLMAKIAIAVAATTVVCVANYPIIQILLRRSPLLREHTDAVTARRRRSRYPGRELRWLFELSVAYTGILLFLMLPGWALSDAQEVRRGGRAGGVITPWRAEPVSLHWLKTEHVALTNDCEVLRLLGVGNNQLVLYDSALDKVFRVPVVDASASVDRDCA